MNLLDPPPGTIRLGFWRHIVETSDEMKTLHRERAKVVHNFVDETGLDLRNSVNVDAETPSEVVEIIVAAIAAEMAHRVVGYLFERIRERREDDDETPLMAVTMRRADGAEIVWDFRHGVSAEQADAAITRFTEGQAVERILGT